MRLSIALISSVLVVATALAWSPLRRVEDNLVFHPTPANKSWIQPPADLPVQDIWLRDSQGSQLHGWWIPLEGAKRTVLFCHGNAGNISHHIDTTRAMRIKLQANVMLIDYPGYGRSQGKPSELNCYEAAETAYDWLRNDRHIPAEQIVLFGYSLGGAVAVELATRKPHAALVLVNTFTSIPAMARTSVALSSASVLVRNRFDNLKKIPNCPRPVFIAHADQDRTIPFTQGQQLAQAAKEPKQFMVLKGADHTRAMSNEFFESLSQFLDRPR